jgi:hypothetical protein
VRRRMKGIPFLQGGVSIEHVSGDVHNVTFGSDWELSELPRSLRGTVFMMAVDKSNLDPVQLDDLENEVQIAGSAGLID